MKVAIGVKCGRLLCSCAAVWCNRVEAMKIFPIIIGQVYWIEKVVILRSKPYFFLLLQHTNTSKHNTKRSVLNCKIVLL